MSNEQEFGLGMPTRDEVIADMKAQRRNGATYTTRPVPSAPAPQENPLEAAFERRIRQEAEDMDFMRGMRRAERVLLVAVGALGGAVAALLVLKLIGG